MKGYIGNILVALFVVLFAGCGTTPPEEVAVNLYNSLTSGNMSYAKKNLHFADSLEYDIVCDFLDLMANSDKFKSNTAGYVADYKATRVTYEGDVAWVELQGVSAAGNSILTVARMVLVDDKWKVDGNYVMLHSLGK